MEGLASRNCRKVKLAVGGLEWATSGFSCQGFIDPWACLYTGIAEALQRGSVQQSWGDKAHEAVRLCNESRQALEDGSTGDLHQAAVLAVNAWGSVLMDGDQCCSVAGPPYCHSSTRRFWSIFQLALPVLVIFFVTMFSIMVLKSCMVWMREACREPQEESPRDPCGSSAATLGATSPDLEPRLQGAWEASCLCGKGDPRRELPGARAWGRAAVSLFSALASAFDFQDANVCNQFDHVISLWRSHCAVVADRRMEEQAAEQDVEADLVHGSSGSSINEDGLLQEALVDLHRDLLEGFCGWRARLRAHSDEEAPEDSELLSPHATPRSGGCSSARAIDRNQGPDSEISARLLLEIGVYLLVWGEAGNLRFMPELLYFVVELALAAERCPGEGFYGSENRGRSGLFLARVVRPIYSVVFEESYTKVEIDAKGKDVKRLKDKYHRFLPADAANYDDWNELFHDPVRLADAVVLDDIGEDIRLFALPRGERFAALHRVSWRRTLAGRRTKTHREVHSMWGVYASVHRVMLLHVVLFFSCVYLASVQHVQVVAVPSLGGQSRAVRFATVGLLVPLHGFSWHYARWEVTGAARRIREFTCREVLRGLRALGCALAWLVPAVTYLWVRHTEYTQGPRGADLQTALLVHYIASAMGIGVGLFVPVYSTDMLWPLTRNTLQGTALRYGFWCLVLAAKTWLSYHGLISKMYGTILQLKLSRVMREPADEVANYLFSPLWTRDVIEEFALWGGTFFLFIADTQLWFTIGCTVLGVCVVHMQRKCACCSFATEDSVANIPRRFCEKVLPYAAGTEDRVPMAFLSIWDRTVEWLRYEGKVSNREMGDLSYRALVDAQIEWRALGRPLDDGESPGGEGAARYRRPQIFRPTGMTEALLRKYWPVGRVEGWPENREARWRLKALARGLGLPMPRPYRAPFIPGITVLVPHYGESILAVKDNELLARPKREQRVDPSPLLSWLADKYQDEFDNFMERMDSRRGRTPSMSPVDLEDVHHAPWPRAGTDWEQYTLEEQWDKISLWASMRMQTLWRTVTGMMQYHHALQCHFEAQGDRRCKLGLSWSPSDCFTCLVSMQMYRHFNKLQVDHCNKMLAKFPESLKVAFIDHQDCEPKTREDKLDKVHPRQHRRYFSCLIDKTCPSNADGARVPIYRIELPGFPILGDGKGDNQNHAIIFTRGTFVQCIDANQGAYFEQMLLLPCVLGEFRSRRPGDGGAKRIVGFPEHITSDFGSVGDFAASAELAFGTILQRAYAVLGARMHYGHPDIMNKEVMMQQGGVSKATKTLNLSEDIFAGMDFVLRGEGRSIHHREYFHVAKGRDLGFNTVIAFFSKISSGCGEQLLTRQTMRLGQLLPLPELLSFYYAHMGYYLTQFLVSWGLPVLAIVWLMVILNSCEGRNDLSMECDSQSDHPSRATAMILADAWQYVFSRSLLVIFLVAQMAPVFFELWLEAGLVGAVCRILKQIFTLAPVMFVFQAKIIGSYTVNELRYGGATYVATGRGLPTERRPFIGAVVDGDLVPGGLYLDYARHTYYDGVSLLFLTGLLVCAGGVDHTGSQVAGILACLALVILSWLYAPFIFNPYQFRPQFFCSDLRAWARFFLDDGGRHWMQWYKQDQLKPRRGFKATVLDLNFAIDFFWIILWLSAFNAKTVTVFHLSPNWRIWYIGTLMPPVALPMLFCCLVVGVEELCRLAPHSGKARDRTRHTRTVYSTLVTRPLERTTSARVQPPAVESPAPPSASPPVPERANAREDAARPRRCGNGCPLMVVAFGVALLTVAELRPLLWMYQIGWSKAFITGFLYKVCWLRFCRQLCMTAVRSSCFPHLGRAARPVELWLLAMSMARDAFASAWIFWTMAPLVLLSCCSGWVCPTWSFHHLLVYRQPGHTSRDSIEVLPWSYPEGGLLDSEESDGYGEGDSDSESDGVERVELPASPPPSLQSSRHAA